MLCTPVWKNDRVSYLSLPLGYRMWQKKESKLELAASMIRQVMPEFQEKRNVIILFESWYMKKNLVAIVEEYQNPSCPHRHLWFKADNGLCNRSRKGYGLPPPVLQHSITGTAADFLRMAGKSPLNQTGSRRMKYIPLFLYSL